MNKKNFIYKTIFCSVIFLCAFRAQAASLPPDPNNAALLYYQALSLWSDVHSSYIVTDAAKDPNDDAGSRSTLGNTILEMDKFYFDISATQEPNDDADSRSTPGNTKLDMDKFLAIQHRIVEYEQKERETRRKQKRNLTIKIVEAASRIPHCTWGIYHSKGWGFHALGSLRHIALLLEDDAKVLTDPGEYRMALERCLTIRRFARHLGDENINMHFVSLSVDGIAVSSIKFVLGSMPQDADTLMWLKNQLAATQGASESFFPALKIDYERALQRLHTSPKTVERIKVRFVEAATYAEDTDAEQKFRNLTNEEMIPLIREAVSTFFVPFFDSVKRVIESDKPYDQTYGELELLIYKLKSSDDFYSIAPFCDLTSIEVTPRFYNLHTNHKTMINAVKAAIEIYLILAKTGQLPETLPDGLPKDPYTLEDFQYKKTKDGFALYSQGEDFQGRLKRKLEFKVKK